MRITQVGPKRVDFLILSCFVVLITLQPFYYHGPINLFEIGLYLPGINAVLHGLVPFRDFFHLRGPLELYVPAIMMQFLGAHIGVLYTYFYVGTVMTLILCVLIAGELLSSRYIFYLMVPVLVGRTFPRVVFHIWGGMRYALGLLAVYLAIKYFKNGKKPWIFWAGVVSILGLFTSIEIGICAVAGILTALLLAFCFKFQDGKSVLTALGLYALGLVIVGVPYLVYLLVNGALLPYFDSVYTVVTNMQKVFDAHLVSIYPSNLSEGVRAMVNPLSKNFRHMTPAYLYIFLLGLIIYRIKKKTSTKMDLCVFCLGIYGFVMYISSFRSLWAAQFEMALQPEKILLFYLIGEIYFYLRKRKEGLKEAGLTLKGKGTARDKILLAGIYFSFLGLFMSCFFYSISRFNKRFFTFKYIACKFNGKSTASLEPLYGEKKEVLLIERAKGILVPKAQAEELNRVIPLIQSMTDPDEALFMYPEMATYFFLADRPFLGRFPMATFSWFNEKWHKELLDDLKEKRPRYVILAGKYPVGWKEVYFGYEINRRKYRDMMALIHAHYSPVARTPASLVLERNH